MLFVQSSLIYKSMGKDFTVSDQQFVLNEVHMALLRMAYANREGSDKPVQIHSLTRSFNAQTMVESS